MHPSKEQQHNSYLHTLQFDRLAKRRERLTRLQGQRDIANINEIKPYNKQMVYRIRQFFIAMKRIDQKDSPIAMKRTRYPNSKRNADSQIAEVTSRDIHILEPSLLLILNTFS